MTTDAKNEGEKPTQPKGLERVVENAFGGASENFGKEITPLGTKAGQVTNQLAHELLRTVAGMVWGYKQIQDWIESKVGEKLDGVPPENLTEPDPRVAGPAIEAMKFAGQAEEIQELFAQLIASDMNKALKSTVHPSFVEIIKQLAVHDTKVFSTIVGTRENLRLTLRVHGLNPKNPDSFHVMGGFVTFEVPGMKENDIEASLNSLERLGLISVKDDMYPVSARVQIAAEEYKQSEGYRIIVGKIAAGKRVSEHKEGIYVTPLGRMFGRVCLSGSISKKTYARSVGEPKKSD